jgi:hypothetical protein
VFLGKRNKLKSHFHKAPHISMCLTFTCEKLFRMQKVCLTWYEWASSKRIACKSWLTRTYWSMLHYYTSCLNPTWPWTRVSTTLILTCQIARTFSIDCTFRTTVRGSAHIVRQARASRCIANCTTLRVWTTRRRHTRIATWRLNRRF